MWKYITDIIKNRKSHMKNKQKIATLRSGRVKILNLALILTSAISLPVSAYTLIDLGANVTPKSINNLGVVAGARNTDQYPATAFSWSSVTGFKNINGGTVANAINNNGIIAGNTVDGAFIENRDWSDYGAFGINQLGEVAGYKVGNNPYQPRSLPYNPAIFNGNKWVFFDIARLYSRGTRQGVYADRYILNAINDSGLSVGYKYRYGLAGTAAILIDTKGPVNDITDVDFLPTPAGGRAVDINKNNRVVGITGSNTRVDPVIYSKAYVYEYDRDNLMILSVLDGGLRSSASDINENNAVVGSSESISGSHAVLWDEAGGVLDLNDEITLQGWVLTSATAINDNGDITGTALLNGVSHGFVLTNGTVTPPPGTENQAPEAVATADVYSGRTPLIVNFDSSASGDADGAIVGYFWDFMDGSTSTEANPEHLFNSQGGYLVKLTVTDNQGLTHFTEVEITVRKKKGKQ